MKKLILFLLLFHSLSIFSQKTPLVYVDKKGVIRYSQTQEEASFFGVNYTLPFAHAYRAMNNFDVNHKEAIDRDVYHFARLGFNAYRIHIWDVEISDEKGNLKNNTHLDLLDYLIVKLKERNIKIVITAMTNFGNGYPERNQETGGFSYLYNKCEIHDDLNAQKAQERYITQLIKHINPYTNQSYLEDVDIIGFEINNEPCHEGTLQQTKDYINRMVKALRNVGNKKPIFYNVSHNMQQIEAYYSSNIQGTTYQWYPTGLVAGRTREGNFLPHIDNYNIPFSNTKGFNTKAKLIYEYDPADNVYGYMHPAMVRSFRTAGFQWITQFAYDPIDMARFNTEYQTHFLNLAYTPQKALSMKIAAEAAYTIPRNKSYGKYPQDTIFDEFRVSYPNNLSELNTLKKFYYSNQTTTQPKNLKSLESIAGCGNSSVVQYEGNGAYFLDKLEDGIWRLEIMPDVFLSSDPFKKTSLKKEVATILWNKWDLQVNLPDFQHKFSISGINKGNTYQEESQTGLVPKIGPGVYLLKRNGVNPTKNWDSNSKWNNIFIGEYVAPVSNDDVCHIAHQQQLQIEEGKNLVIEAEVFSSTPPDSVIIYTDKVSFWNKKNPYVKMSREKGYTYRTTIPGNKISSTFKYNIVAFVKGKAYTYPQAIEGSPLDWNFTENDFYATKQVKPTSSILIFDAQKEHHDLESYTLPEWYFIQREYIDNSIIEKASLKVSFISDNENPTFYLQKSIKSNIKDRLPLSNSVQYICMLINYSSKEFQIGFVTNMGFTYKQEVKPSSEKLIKVPISELKQSATVLLPLSFPVFMNKYFYPDIEKPFNINDIEKLEISFEGKKNQKEIIDITAIWLE